MNNQEFMTVKRFLLGKPMKELQAVEVERLTSFQRLKSQFLALGDARTIQALARMVINGKEQYRH